MICENPRPTQSRKILRGFVPLVLSQPGNRKVNPALTEEEEDVRDAKAALRHGKFQAWEDVKRELGL